MAATTLAASLFWKMHPRSPKVVAQMFGGDRIAAGLLKQILSV